MLDSNDLAQYNIDEENPGMDFYEDRNSLKE